MTAPTDFSSLRQGTITANLCFVGAGVGTRLPFVWDRAASYYLRQSRQTRGVDTCHDNDNWLATIRGRIPITRFRPRGCCVSEGAHLDPPAALRRRSCCRRLECGPRSPCRHLASTARPTLSAYGLEISADKLQTSCGQAAPETTQGGRRILPARHPLHHLRPRRFGRKVTFSKATRGSPYLPGTVNAAPMAVRRGRDFTLPGRDILGPGGVTSAVSRGRDVSTDAGSKVSRRENGQTFPKRKCTGSSSSCVPRQPSRSSPTCCRRCSMPQRSNSADGTHGCSSICAR